VERILALRAFNKDPGGVYISSLVVADGGLYFRLVTLEPGHKSHDGLLDLSYFYNVSQGDKTSTRGERCLSVEDGKHLIVNTAVAGTYRRLVDGEGLALIARHPTAGLFDQQLSGSHIPRVQAFLPKPVKPAAGYICHIDCRRAVAANSSRLHQKGRQMACEI